MSYTLYLADHERVDLKTLAEKLSTKHTGWVVVAEQENLANDPAFVQRLKDHNKQTGDNVTVVSSSVPGTPDISRWSPDLMWEAQKIVAIFPDGSARVVKDKSPVRVNAGA
jgi:hypothetical protein